MNSNRGNVISEQSILERFGEPLTSEEMTEAAKKTNWADYKVPEKKAPKKKGGPKPKFWGRKHPKRVKPKLDEE